MTGTGNNTLATLRSLKAKRLRRKIFAGIALLLLFFLGFFVVPQLISLPDPEYARIRQYGSQSIVQSSPAAIPAYAGADYVTLNEGIPGFNEWELSHVSGEHYSPPDSLGRCGPALAMLDHSMMPAGARGSIGSITPTGWIQKKYPGIVDSDPPYLYNRCHLIAYALTGQNANERNLITGTRHMNTVSMLPWEEKVMRYLDTPDHHVLYRVTPYFKEKELLPRGVEMEAFSTDDNGASLCFHVFIYNVQPGIDLDYATGESRRDETYFVLERQSAIGYKIVIRTVSREL
ncbi:MAG: DNA/RNA non-specific endonuclease [Blautia sp.]|nr:DNA/RNA non-specific endonuclease [Blautia sp.]